MELLVYLIPLAVVIAVYGWRRWKLTHVSRVTHSESQLAGLTEPASLHPAIDPLKCIGCGSCVKACPEQPEHQVLGILNGKAALVSPTSCIGHGACKTACPVDAITLVFGTATRGVDLPRVSPWFETNVPGIYVAGELGGMGLIRNAVEQGRQAVAEIVKRRPKGGNRLDLVIVGAGPAGFTASLAARQHGLRFATIEQESLGGCVYQYPRGKIVMTQPAELPLIGRLDVTLTSKEELLAFWHAAEKRAGLQIRYRERVERISRDGPGFVVKTTRGELRTHSVLLAIGRRGTPRKLNVPGEDLAKVVYRLIEPEQYAGQRVLVVGGGDSALEAAATLAEADVEKVLLSYRGDAFGRAKARNRQRVDAAASSGRLTVVLKSEVKLIDDTTVVLDAGGRALEVPNDAVIVNAGGVLPTDFLKDVGIEVETKYGTA